MVKNGKKREEGLDKAVNGHEMGIEVSQG